MSKKLGKDVQCLLCKKWFSVINSAHTVGAHSINIDEYIAKFPHATIISAKRRKVRGEAIKAAFDKMEDTELETIKERRAEGIRSKFSAMSKTELKKLRSKQSKSIKKSLSSRTPEAKELHLKRVSKAAKKRMARMSTEKWRAICKKISKSLRKRFASMNEAELRTHIENSCGLRGTSRIETKMIRNIKALGYEVKHHVKVGRFEVDAYIPELNLVVEMYGDYWHANPKMFKTGDIHPTIGTTASSIWERNSKRVTAIREFGYTVAVVWESDLETKGFKKTLRKVIKHADCS